jgi:hypothetical protein
VKILFYLPVITPWWFENIITPMLRSLYDEAELHIIVAPLWNNTGLETRHVAPLVDLDRLNWHIVVPDDDAQFRLDGAAVDGLIDLVRSIDADITIARSADRTTPALFPGIVRHIMEPGALPFHTPHRWYVLEDLPFHHGVMPPSASPSANHAAHLLAPWWDRIEAAFAEPSPGAFRHGLGLPADRPVLAVPLQYEHPENLYGLGSPLQAGVNMLGALLDQLDERIILAVTDHPLNAQHLDRAPLHRLAAAQPDRIRLLLPSDEQMNPTAPVIRAADAVLIDRSKCVSLAAFFGTPIIHVGDSMMADWLNATPLAQAGRALCERRLAAPDRKAAQQWFGWHIGMRLTRFTDLSLSLLLERIHGTSGETEIATLLQFLDGWLEASVEDARNQVDALSLGTLRNPAIA